jgi:hypothetical protein
MVSSGDLAASSLARAAALQLVLDLRPLRLDRLFLADEPVVRAAGASERSNDNEQDAK